MSHEERVVANLPVPQPERSPTNMIRQPIAPIELDRIDLKILQALQEDGRMTNRDLAEKVALSPSACLARVKHLEAHGVIYGYRASLAVELIRPTIAVYAQIAIRRHNSDAFEKFDAVLDGLPEVVEAARVSGPFDYMMKIVVTDISEWQRLADILLHENNDVEKMVTHFLVNECKRFAGFPLAPAGRGRT